MFEEIVEEGGNYSGESQLDVEGRLARLCVGLHAWAVSETGDRHTDISFVAVRQRLWPKAPIWHLLSPKLRPGRPK